MTPIAGASTGAKRIGLVNAGAAALTMRREASRFIQSEFISSKVRARMVNRTCRIALSLRDHPNADREPTIKRSRIKAIDVASRLGTGVRQKIFRVERNSEREALVAIPGTTNPARQHDEIMTELRELRALIDPQQEQSIHQIEAQKAKLTEFQKLKQELDLVYDAIKRTKQEIATLHVSGFHGPEMARAAGELGAIVGGTETATQSILSAAEDIDQAANTLSAAVRSEQERGLTQDIQERVIKIFEACNFQDLTGQRISKVVATLRFIEHHIVQMIDIWGGIEALEEFKPEAFPERQGDRSLLNGPKLDGDAGHASQDDIDALFT
jgi:chemotaxis protein CheZ